MIPTPQQVYDDTRFLLEDRESGGAGTRWANPNLRPFLQTAWSEIYSQALAHDLPLIKRSVYPILVPYTATLYPSTAGIAHMGEPKSLGERSFDSNNSVAITGITVSNGVATVTCSGGHPFLSGQWVTHHGILGLSDDINDVWMVEKINSTSYYIRGCTATGTYTSGGTATYSLEDFVDMDGPVDDKYFGPTVTPSTSLGMWKWERDRFSFPGATTSRQLRIIFRLSDTLPTTDGIGLGVDGCLPYLKFRTAALAIVGIAPQTAAQWNAIALGSTGQVKDLGGLLGELLRPQIRTGQRLPIHRPGYRPRRATGPVRLTGIG